MEVRTVAVSVIVPVYNVESYLPACLDSLRRQRLRDLEILCVNDGSTDSSPLILRRYAAADPRIRVIDQDNVGAGRARNIALDAAAGEYLFFCDPDDWCAPRLLSRLLDAARSTEADVVISGYVKYDDETSRVYGYGRVDRRIRGRRTFEPLEFRDTLFSLSRHTVWDKLFRADFIRARGIRFQEIRRFNDMYFCDVSLAMARRIAVIDRADYRHRIGRADGLQGGRCEEPGLLLDAYAAIRTRLTEAGLAENFGRALARAEFDSSVPMLVGIRDRQKMDAYYSRLRTDTAWLSAEDFPRDLGAWHDNGRLFAILAEDARPDRLVAAVVEMMRRRLALFERESVFRAAFRAFRTTAPMAVRRIIG